jgi:hypothetical protein
MTQPPAAAPRTQGRIFGTDWSIANVARLLRANAGRGVWRTAATASGSTGSVNQYYLRTASAHHLPSEVSVIFMRLEQENCWYLSLCFAVADEVQPWNSETAELWLRSLFGEDRPRARESPGLNPNVRQFTLSMEI